MNYKKNLIILIIAIILYFVFNSIYNKVIKNDNYVDIYVLNKDVNRGQLVNLEDLNKVKVSKNLKIQSFELNDEYVYKDKLYKNHILDKSILLEKSKYIQSDLEIISIKLNSIENAGSYQIEEGSVVNIFYTAQATNVRNVLEKLSKDKIFIGEGSLEKVTVKLFENIKVLKTYDKNGAVTNLKSIDNREIKTINVEVSKEEAILFNTLKDKGEFSISILK